MQNVVVFALVPCIPNKVIVNASQAIVLCHLSIGQIEVHSCLYTDATSIMTLECIETSRIISDVSRDTVERLSVHHELWTIYNVCHRHAINQNIMLGYPAKFVPCIGVETCWIFRN